MLRVISHIVVAGCTNGVLLVIELDQRIGTDLVIVSCLEDWVGLVISCSAWI